MQVSSSEVGFRLTSAQPERTLLPHFSSFSFISLVPLFCSVFPKLNFCRLKNLRINQESTAFTRIFVFILLHHFMDIVVILLFSDL